MTRVNAETSAGPSYEWADDTWYPVALQSYEVQPKDREVTFQGKTRKARWVTLAMTWVLLPDIEADIWVRDFVDIRLGANQDGTAPRCKLLVCCLAGRDARKEPNAWCDDETFEYGFDAEKLVVSGRITTGIRLQVKGKVKASEKGSFLAVERYAAMDSQAGLPLGATATAGTGTAPPRRLSPDGQWEWNGSEWVPA